MPPVAEPIHSRIPRTASKRKAMATSEQPTSTERRCGGTLYTEPVLVIDQKPKLIEMSTAYAVLDENGQRLGSVVEVGQSQLKKAARFFGDFNNFYTHRLEMRDASDIPALTVTRPRKVFKSKVIVDGPAGQPIGRIVQENWMGKKRFALLADGTRIGTIHADRLLQPRRFTIVDHTGSEIARIIRTTAGLERAIVAAETYALMIDKRLREPIASLVLASAVAINTAIMQVKSSTVLDLIP
ncbi:phospholipid scramblase-related protein [Nocardia sp. NPDC049526]|uniref:phospholipid scramblase-related protein n=1 Tax=Nocardia sp. NPDC049526 TaxID=3364316 RepID=UPI0037ABE5AF